MPYEKVFKQRLDHVLVTVSCKDMDSVIIQKAITDARSFVQ